MPEITIFTRPDCGNCHNAKCWLHDHKLRYDELIVGKQADTAVLRAISGTERIPQIFINGQHVGGFDQLKGHEQLLPQSLSA